jgi:hypothetical protein
MPHRQGRAITTFLRAVYRNVTPGEARVAPTFSPRNGQVVNPRRDRRELERAGAEHVEIIIENTDLGDVFDVTVSGPTRRLTIPPQFLRRGKEYTIELLSIAENRNRTIAQSTFRPAS